MYQRDQQRDGEKISSLDILQKYCRLKILKPSRFIYEAHALVVSGDGEQMPQHYF